MARAPPTRPKTDAEASKGRLGRNSEDGLCVARDFRGRFSKYSSEYARWNEEVKEILLCNRRFFSRNCIYCDFFYFFSHVTLT